MTTFIMFATGAVLTAWIGLRNPGHGEPYAWWPTWKEWAVGTLGVVLMGVAALRVIFAWVVT